MALSTTEAKYIAACAACSKDMWLQKMLLGLFDLQLEVTWIYCDNQSCIKLSKNLMFHEKYKHIEIKYPYIRDMVEKGVMELLYIAMDEHIVDILTKPLYRLKLEYFRDKIGVVPRKRE